MKKIIFIIMLFISTLCAEIIMNKATVDEIGLGGIYPNIKLLDKEAAGMWFLRIQYPQKWEKVKNDEFELHDAVNNSFNVLISLSKEKYNEYINKNAYVGVRIRFGKYNFQGKYFPLNAMTKDSYLAFEGNKFIDELHLYFDNTGDKEKKLYMEPQIAKNFIENRKDTDGYIDRTLIAKYYFKLKKINTDVSPINETDSNTWLSYPDTKVIGHIYKIEIIDPKTNKVLVTFNKK